MSSPSTKIFLKLGFSFHNFSNKSASRKHLSAIVTRKGCIFPYSSFPTYVKDVSKEFM